jgi:hypothetical protein
MSGEPMIDAILARWLGCFDNARQVAANMARGGPPAPELSRERRRLEVQRLEGSALGGRLLYFQEFRASRPGLAHRQRVMRLVWDPEHGAVRAEQLFFAAGPAYDRPPLDAEAVAALPPAAFVRHPGCDLFFRHETELDRWRGAMRPGACRYRHPEDGEVCAEYEMLLPEGQLWYRDRSLRLSDGTVRGEIDGFSWVLFDRLAPGASAPDPLPALMRQQGVWRGRFRRYDAEGECREQFASTIVLRILEREGKLRYHQSNLYRWPDGSEQAFDSEGEVRDGRVWFHNEQFAGWAMDLPAADADDDGATAAVLRLWPRQPGGPEVLEVIHCSADGRTRRRCSQSLLAGRVVRRTFIDEEKISDDWRAWDAAAPTDG